MLAHAALFIRNSSGEYIAIPVKNFPELPIGQELSFYIDEEGVWFEDGRITEYRTDNKRGIRVVIDLVNVKEGADGFEQADRRADERWGAIAKACVEDTSNTCDLVYPHEVDYSNPFPIPTDTHPD